MARLARKFAAALAVMAGAALPSASYAAQDNVQFWGNITINNPCVVVLGRQGQLGVSPDLRQLSSKISGGVSGVADIYSMVAYQISVDGPTFFATAPGGGNNGVAFTASYSGSSILRGVSFPEQPGNQQVRLNPGFSITRVNIHLVANRPDAFPGGDYTAIATVRCE